MAGILGYLSVLADDISTLASKSVATSTKSLATSLDDVGLLFDDIATYSKLATAKSSGILVDDLAAIANMTNETTSQILKEELKKASSIDEFKTNISNLSESKKNEILKELEHLREVAILEARRKAASRELPIVLSIAKGSLLNKFIIIPIVLALSFFAPWIISPLLILGGTYLAYEGMESILKKITHHTSDETNNEVEQHDENFEAQKIKSAIKTDFILSFEIIVIALSILGEIDFIAKLSVLSIVGLLTTIFVYGIVAFIIKLDDIGFYLQEKRSKVSQSIGNGFVQSMPYIIKAIAIFGTIAMLAVGGGIISHETHILEPIEHITKPIPLGGFISDIILGIIVGLIAILIVNLASKKINI